MNESLLLVACLGFAAGYIFKTLVQGFKTFSAAKKLRLEHEHQFNIWREEIVEEYLENYPSDYKWQLQFDDWKGMMDELTDIYKEKRI